MNQFQTALEKTRAWLDQHFDADGVSVIDANDPRYYTKTPYLLATVGLRAKGARVAKQVTASSIGMASSRCQANWRTAST